MWIWSDELTELASGARAEGPERIPLLAYAVAEGTDLDELARHVLGESAASSQADDREPRNRSGCSDR